MCDILNHDISDDIESSSASFA